jgi:predicted Zn finger-like uncharacterized protein
LFTVCPKCTLTLVVTTVDLRAGQGYVRCGRCANVFNALIALREGDPANGISDTARRRLLETAPKSVEPARGSGVAMDPTPEPEPEPEPQPEPDPEIIGEPEAAPEGATEETVEETPEEIVLSSEGPDSIDSETEGAEASLEFDAAATDVSDIFISPSEAEHDTGSGSYEAVVLAEESVPQPVAEPETEPVAGMVEDPSHTDTIAADDWSLLDDDEPPADAESVIEESPYAQAPEPAPSTPQPDPPWVEEMFAEAEAQAEAKTRHARVTGRRATDVELEEEVEAAPAKAPPTPPSDAAIAALHGAPVKRRPQWQYLSGVALLVVALLFQVAHHNRQNLVLSPSLGPLMSMVYGWFGVTLMPRWDLTAYSVTLMGAKTEGAEGTRLRVSLSLQNKSMRVQPLPLLRLTLQDRYGNAVATRDLEPQDYLPKRAADLRLLEPDQRIDTEVHVVDPGKAAEGYVIDACLRGEGGSVGCANDTRRPTVG